MTPPPHVCPKCGASADECLVEHYEGHPFVQGGPEVAAYRCLECGHEGRTAHPDLHRDALEARGRKRAQEFRRRYGRGG